MKKVIPLFFVLIWTFTTFPALGQGPSGKQLFINLTSKDLARAGMAIEFSTKVMKVKQIPATIFLNSHGVNIAHMGVSSPVHATGRTLREMLNTFLENGGQVFICPMCMKHVGKFKEDQVMPGVRIAGKEMLDLLFADGSKVMSY